MFKKSEYPKILKSLPKALKALAKGIVALGSVSEQGLADTIEFSGIAERKYVILEFAYSSLSKEACTVLVALAKGTNPDVSNCLEELTNGGWFHRDHELWACAQEFLLLK